MLPPQAIDLEAAVLGAMLLEKDLHTEVFEILHTHECFYNNHHASIFEVLKEMHEKRLDIDLLTVMAEMTSRNILEEIGGAYALTKLTAGVVSSAHTLSHCRIIKQKWVLRGVIRVATETIVQAYDPSSDCFEVIDYLGTEIDKISHHTISKDLTTVQEGVMVALDSIERKMAQTTALTGTPSGFPKLDEITNGWQRTDLIVLAARPSVGKTALALNLLSNATIEPEDAAAVFSLEMSTEQLINRLLAITTQVPLEQISNPKNLRNPLSEYNLARLLEAEALLKKSIHIDDTAGLTITQLKAKLQRLKRRLERQGKKLKLVVIDYLQLMHGSGNEGNREQEISRISRELKGVAKTFDVPVIALSQLSRKVEERSVKIPTLADLRESGAIEQDADMVMFTYRPADSESPDADHIAKNSNHLDIAKHRNGRLDSILLHKNMAIQTFSDEPIIWHGQPAQTEQQFNPRAGFENVTPDDYEAPPF